MVVSGTPSTNEGGDSISQTEVGTDNEPLQLADRHFELVIFRRQQGTTAKRTDWGGDYPIQADFGGNPNTATTAEVAAREEAAIGQHRQGIASTDKNKQYDPGGTGDDPFISFCLVAMLYTACSVLCVFLFCFAFLAIFHVIVPGTEGSKKCLLKMGAIKTWKPEKQLLSYPMDHLGP